MGSYGRQIVLYFPLNKTLLLLKFISMKTMFNPYLYFIQGKIIVTWMKGTKVDVSVQTK